MVTDILLESKYFSLGQNLTAVPVLFRPTVPVSVNSESFSNAVFQNNQWYIPINTFINFIGGNVSTNETEIKIKIENETIILKKNTSLEIENNIYVSANEIKTKFH